MIRSNILLSHIYTSNKTNIIFFSCWLSTESGSLYMFIIPVCLIALASNPVETSFFFILTPMTNVETWLKSNCHFGLKKGRNTETCQIAIQSITVDE